MKRALLHLLACIALSCRASSGDGRCVEATQVVDADLRKLVDGMPYEPFDAEELNRKAKGIVGTGENTCTREGAKNKAFQVDIMKRMLKTATDAFDAEVAARKKDPNIAKRGPKPRSNNALAGGSVDLGWAAARVNGATYELAKMGAFTEAVADACAMTPTARGKGVR